MLKYLLQEISCIGNRVIGYCLFALVILSSVDTKAQTVYTFSGNAGTLALDAPICKYVAKWNASAMLYPASGFNGGAGFGTISKIGYNCNGSFFSGTAIPIKIYIKTVGAATTLASSTWTAAITGATLVYTGSFNLGTAGGWCDIALTTPFVWSSGNLEILVECDWATTVTTVGDPNWTYNTATSTDVNWISNTSAAALASSTACCSTPDKYRADIRITEGGCSTPATPIVSVTNNCGNSVMTITNPASGATFLWSDGGTNNPRTFTTTGAKTVTQTAGGCTSAAGSGTDAQLTVPATPTVSVANNCGNSVMTITNPAGGATFLWSDAGTNNPRTFTTTGAKTVTQTAGGCTSAAGSGTDAQLTVPATPIVSVANNCGNSVMTITNPAGGATFLWSDAGTNNPRTFTTTGAKTVTQTAGGCTSAAGSGTDAQLTVPATPIVSVANNCGNSVMTITNPAGGATFLWSDAGTNNPRTFTTAGAKTVTQTAGGCTSAAGNGTDAQLTVPATPIVSVANNCGNSVMTITNPAGGATFLWSDAGTNNPHTVNSAGVLTVTQSAGGCTSAAGNGTDAQLTVPATPTVSVANNCGNSVMTITNPAGGATFLWSDAGTNNPHTVNSAGVLTVTQSAGGCTSASGNGTDAQLTVPATPTVSVANNCGNSVMTITNPAGGATFLWSDAGTNNPHTVNSAGVLTVTQSAGGCTSAAGNGTDAQLTVPATPTVSVANNCGNSVMTITNPAGGATFLWSDAGTNNPHTVNVASTLTVTQSAGGCTSGNSNSATSAPLPLPVFTANGTNVTCNGAGNGQISVSPSGGAGPYIYSIDAGSTYPYSASPITGLSPNTYNIRVQDNNGCVSLNSSPVAITQPNVLTNAHISSTNVQCHGGGNGTVTVFIIPTGGTTPYQYSLDGGITYQSTISFVNLNPGSYAVTAKDAHGCTSTSNTVTITEPASSLASAAITETDATCNGANNGKVTVSTLPTGGTPAYTYSFNGGAFSPATTYANLAPGNYTITVQDAQGCSLITNTVTVNQPTAIATAALINTNVSCNGLSNGTVTVNPTASGGTPGYTYSLNGGAFTGTITYNGLAPNNYTVTVKDANNCTFNTNTVAVTQPNVLVVVATNDGPYYGTTQTIHLFTAVTGGTTAYTYNWSGPLSFSSTSPNPAIANAIVPMTGIYHVTVTDANGCTATDTSYVQVNSSLTYTWTGAVSTDWNIGGNWTPFPVLGVVGCWADVYIPGGMPHQPIVSSAVNIGNLKVDAGALLTLNADVSLCKDLTGGSSCCASYGIITGTGSLILNGAVLEKINALIRVNVLKLDNSAGAQSQANSDLQIVTSLDLQSGNFDAGNNITFLSTSVSQIGIIDNFSAGYSGTMSGNIHAQRYYNATTTANSYSQHFMGSPVSTPAFSQFGANGTAGRLQATATCDESRIAIGSPYSTVLALDETNGATCTTNQWIAEIGGNSQNGTGYAVAKQGAGVMTLTGTANLNNTYPVTNLTNSGWSPTTTLQGHTVTAGWHLVSNPYLATLNINTHSTGFDDQIQVWNTYGPFAGSYTQGIVGTDAVVAPFQGFMVHKTAAGGTATYTLSASDRVRTPQAFFRANDNELKIVAENMSNNLLDQTTVAFNTAATDQFDPQYDANKPSGYLNRHTLYSVNNGLWMGRNILHDIAQTSTVPVGFEPGATATYNFSFNGVNTFDPTSYIFLEDKALNIMHNARNGDYSFTADSTDAWDRFVLHFTPAATMSITDASCTTQGVINIVQPGTANWNYTITDNNTHAAIANGALNQNTPISINAPTGSYTLTLTDINNYTVTEVLQVNGPDAITAVFAAPATVQEGQNVVLSSTTTNATSYQWNLGNGQTASGATVTYDYPAAGTYTVVLTVTNLSGCTSTASQTITVSATATGLNSVTDNKGIGIWSNENRVYVDFRSLQKVDAVISIYNILGQEISNEKFNSNMLYQKEISNIEAAYMIVSVKTGNKIISKKVFINNIR